MGEPALKKVNMHEAKTQLSALVASEEPFILANAGRPRAVVIPYDQYLSENRGTVSRIGFMPKLDVSDDFDSAYAAEIEAAFYGGETL